jgi:hypothetical protein
MSNPVIVTSSLPNGNVGSSYVAHLIGSGGLSPYTYDVVFGSLPPGISLSTAGVLRGTPTTAGAYTATFELTDSGAGLTYDADLTITISSGSSSPPSITTSSLGGGIVGAAYSQGLSVSGGTAPFSFSISAGALTPGLSIDPTAGTISGTPTSTGSYSFTVTCTDSLSLSGSAALSISVASAATTPSITTSSLPGGTVGTAYSQPLAVTGGTAPLFFNVFGGSLPVGLSLDSAVGTISGTPTSAGTYGFAIRVTDSLYLASSTPLSITVAPAPTSPIITTTSLPDGEINTAYSQTIAVTAGTAPYTFGFVAGSSPYLPPGITLNTSTGVISGTTTGGGTFDNNYLVTDSLGLSVSQVLTFTIDIPPAPPAIAYWGLPTAAVGVAYTDTVTTEGATNGAVTWAITAGTIPPGLTFSSGGVLSGTPTTAGSYTITVTVTDSLSLSASQAFTVPVEQGVAITTASLPNGAYGTFYSQTVTTSGGTGAIGFSVGSGMPSGFSFTGVGQPNGTIVISGVPTSSGAFSFAVTAVDSFGFTSAQTYSITITPPGVISNPAIVTPSLPAAGYEQLYLALLGVLGGSAPYVFTISAGALPPGITINAGDGALSGIASAPGIFNFHVTVTDSGARTGSTAYTIYVPSPAAPPANTLSPGVLGPMLASGGLAPVWLCEVLTASGSQYLWSEQNLANTSSLTTSGGGTTGNYRGWLVGSPKCTFTGTTQTDTASVSIQNYSGNTVMRDIATYFTEDEFINALVVLRLWRADAEVALVTFVGNVSDVELDDEEMTLSMEGFNNFSATVAPAYLIGENCPLFFGSAACASTSATPCQNTYGTCSSLERFAGVVIYWVNGSLTVVPNTQIAQPPPVAVQNKARAF